MRGGTDVSSHQRYACAKFFVQDGVTMSRPVSKLFDIEIDEVSVVDRPANQGGLIAFAKNAGNGAGPSVQEDHMPVYTNADGVPVDTDKLNEGDLVYDENGFEYVFTTEDIDDVDDLQFEDSDEREPELVGASKSLGDSILEELSKAVTDDERNVVVAKALDRMRASEREVVRLSKALEAEQDQRITEAFISKAAEYNLPVAPEVLGPILKAVAEVLTDDQLDVLDQLFESVGDTLYQEVGYVGDTDNDSVVNRVNAAARELVGKSDGVSDAQAFVALLEANPAAYDAYLAENGR